MPPSPGACLEPYEVTGSLGEGGIGDVYSARDTRLDRTVAIEVLPATLATDPIFRSPSSSHVIRRRHGRCL